MLLISDVVTCYALHFGLYGRLSLTQGGYVCISITCIAKQGIKEAGVAVFLALADLGYFLRDLLQLLP
ncbi:hypothetical protein D3C78_1848310 [compost metagenome]